MTAKLFSIPKQFVLTNEGALVKGAKAYFYIYGTSTLQNTYTDSTLATANANPVVADGNGRWPAIYLDDSKRYKVKVTDASDVPIFTEDDFLQQTVVNFEISDEETNLGITPTDTSKEVGNVLRYGADNTGTLNSSTAFNNCSAVIKALGGGIMVVPPGEYLHSSQWTMQAPDTVDTKGRIEVLAYGASIRTTGAIAGCRLLYGGNVGGITVHGLTIDHSSNTDALYGFLVEQTWGARISECVVRHNGDANAAGYAAVRVRNLVAATGSTGSYWTTIEKLRVRRATGSNNIPVGVLLEGNSNSTKLIDCEFNSCDAGVKLQAQPTTTVLPNTCHIAYSAFEGCTTAIEAAPGANASSGPTISFCRAESCTNFFVTDATASAALPPYLIGNYTLSDVTNYIVNPNGVKINTLDLFTTPSIDQQKLSTPLGFQLRAETAANHPLTLQTPGNDTGLEIKRSDGNAVGSIEATSSGINVLGVEYIDATPGGGGARIQFGSDQPGPAGAAISAPVGSIYLRTDGSTSTTLYVKESGTDDTGWVAK